MLKTKEGKEERKKEEGRKEGKKKEKRKEAIEFGFRFLVKWQLMSVHNPHGIKIGDQDPKNTFLYL